MRGIKVYSNVKQGKGIGYRAEQCSLRNVVIIKSNRCDQSLRRFISGEATITIKICVILVYACVTGIVTT